MWPLDGGRKEKSSRDSSPFPVEASELLLCGRHPILRANTGPALNSQPPGGPSCWNERCGTQCGVIVETFCVLQTRWNVCKYMETSHIKHKLCKNFSLDRSHFRWWLWLKNKLCFENCQQGRFSFLCIQKLKIQETVYMPCWINQSTANRYFKPSHCVP